MPNLPDSNFSSHASSNRTRKHDKYAYLRAEAKAPYRILRRFIYVAFGASGFIGSVVFLAQLLTFQDVSHTLPNLILQLGLVALMVWLFKADRAKM